MESVVIVHGLWMHGAIFSLLRRRLRGQGFDAHTFSYASVRQAFDQHVRALSGVVKALRGTRVHLVGHSLGGLLCMHYAAAQPDPRLTRIVLLGSPVKGSFVAARLAERPVGRHLLGAAQNVLLQGIPNPRIKDAQIGVIAGNLGVGLGRMITALPEPHDGTVTVAETQVPGLADRLLMPVTHTGLVFSSQVAYQTGYFLAHGRFFRGPSA